MEARIVRAREVGPGDEAAWRGLAARAIDPNPLYEPDCLIPAARHQQFGSEIDVVFAEDGGRMLACIPVRRVRQWRQFPYPWVTTAVRRMMYCGTPLLDPERSDEAMAAIFTALRDRRGPASGRVLVLQEVAEGGPVDQAIQEAARRVGFPLIRYESWERPLVYRRQDGNYRSIHSSRFHKKLRRRQRLLTEELGSEPKAVDRSDDPRAIDEFIEMEAAGYKGQNGVALAAVPGEPEYFREMCQRFARHGRLRVLALEGGGKTVAMVIGLVGGDGLFDLKTSYDEQFARYAPGIQVQLEEIENFHAATDAQWLDPCTYEGNGVLLNLFPDRRRYSSFFVPLSKNPVDRLVARSFVRIRAAHKRVYHAVEARRRAGHTAKPTGESPEAAEDSGG